MTLRRHAISRRTAAAVSKSSESNRSRLLLAKSPDVFGAGLGCHLCLALDHDADLLDDLGVGKRSDVANFHCVGDGGQHLAHGLPLRKTLRRRLHRPAAVAISPARSS